MEVIHQTLSGGMREKDRDRAMAHTPGCGGNAGGGHRIKHVNEYESINHQSRLFSFNKLKR